MKKKKLGFTLIEMVIVLAIVTIVLGIVNSMFISGNKVFSDSDVKSTLQIEGQSIQERISNIGMQGAEVVSVAPNIIDGQITSIVIKSYINGTDYPKYFKIKRNGRIFSIDRCSDRDCNNIENTNNLSESIDSFGIHYSADNRTIEFNIVLSMEKGYSDVKHHINFTTTFRNK